MRQPTLSICIPTYNRAQFAYDAAVNILSAWTGDDIEVVVSDNCSDDNTAELLSSVKDGRFHYYRNERNLGAAYNTHLSFLRAQGKFAYLTSDEDDLRISEIPYLLEYFNQHPNIAVFIGGGDLTYTKKRFTDAVYTSPFAALKAVAFQTRYMTGIILNQRMYAKTIGNVSFAESANLWDAYSFMYAIARLCCCGDVVTSSHLLFHQPRLAMTDVSNNARDDGIYYYEPQARVNQMRVWAKTISTLPIDAGEQQYMVMKIVFDTIRLVCRLFDPAYIDEVKKTVSAKDFEVYFARVAKLNEEQLSAAIYDQGNRLFGEMFGLPMEKVEIDHVQALFKENITGVKGRLGR